MEKKNKKIIFASFFAVIFLLLLEYLHTHQLCGVTNDIMSEDMCRKTGNILLISLPCFVFSLLTMFMGNSVGVKLWTKYTIWYCGLFVVIIGFTPSYWGDEFMNIQKGTVAIFLTILYSIISLCIIVWGSLRKKSVEGQ